MGAVRNVLRAEWSFVASPGAFEGQAWEKSVVKAERDADVGASVRGNAGGFLEDDCKSNISGVIPTIFRTTTCLMLEGFCEMDQSESYEAVVCSKVYLDH